MALTSQQYPIDRTKTWGAQLSNLTDQLQRFLSLLDQLHGKMVQTRLNPSDPGTPNDAAVEQQFGLVPGTGGAVWTQLDTAATSIGLPANNPSGQINRIAVWAALKQFVDQVG